MKVFKINKIIDSKFIFQKIKTSLLYVLFFMFALNCMAESSYSQLVRLNMNIEKPSLKDAIVEIKNQTEFDFLYSKDIESLYQAKELITIENGTIEEVLDQLFINSRIDYKIVDKTIALMPARLAVTENTNNVHQISQQGITISGTVTDNSGDLLTGVNITVKGTPSIGAITDIDGKYAITAPSTNTVLVFSYIGFVSQEITVGNRRSIDVILLEDAQQIEEVVVIGYGVQRVREVTGAVARVESDIINKIASSDFSQGLQGQIAGLNVTSTGGTPGAQAIVQIRGTGSFTTDGIDPLYVVDGIPYRSMPNFSSDEIESVDVLKDAASASIYGTRASNGVILITTKKGKAGELKVAVDSYYGITNIHRNMPIIHNTLDWLYVNRIRYIAINDPTLGWTALDDNQRGLHNNTNWQEHFQTKNAPVQNYTVRLSGGNQNLTHSLVTTYFKQQGLWVNSDFERLSTRANSQFKKKRFSANVGLSFSMSNERLANSSLMTQAVSARPFKAPVDATQDRFPAPGSNVAYISSIVTSLKEIDKRRRYDGSANIELSYDFFDGFQIKTRMGGSINTSFRSTYNPTFYLYDEITGADVAQSYPIARLQSRNSLNSTWVTEYMATYDKSFGSHKLNLLAMYSMENQTRETFDASKREFLSNDIQVLSGGSIDPTATGTKNSTSIIGSLARIQYNYASRYMLSASIRRDGSSKFGQENRYGVFPSVMGAWYMSDESFYDNSSLKKILSDAKIRLSFGTTGNQFISDYEYVGLVEKNNDYVLGVSDQALALGVIQTSLVNSDMKWETSISKNVGIDLTFLNGKFSLSSDLYYTNKNDMLFPVTIPPSAGTGGGTINMNVGNMVNKGIELTAAYRKMRGDFRLTVTGTFTSNSNMVTKTNLTSSTMWGGSSGDNTTIIREGFPVASFYLIPVHENVLIRTQEELTEYRKLVPGAILGDIWLIDTNGDGVLNDEDRVFQGTGAPKWEGGLTFTGNYKQFDFNVQLYGTYGNKIFNGAKRNAYANKRHLDMMNSYNRDANVYNTNIPTPNGNMSHENYRGRHNYYLEDGSYLRIRNVQIGYSLPRPLLNKVSIERCRFYLSVDNLFTFTKYTGMDPEVAGNGLMTRGVDNSYRPVTINYRLGFQLDF